MKKLFPFIFASLLPMCAVADVEINETNFPDAKFRTYLLSWDDGADGVLSDASLNMTYLNVSSMSISNLKGIEYFVHLKTLSCGDNLLTELDLSANRELTYIDCSKNMLTTLDLSNCSTMERIECYGNKISGAAMDEFMENLPVGSSSWGGSASFCLVDETDANEQNEATVAQVKIAKDKNYMVRCLKTNEETGEKYYDTYRGVVYESTEGLAITKTRFPDENFRNYLLDQPYGDDGVITEQEIASVVTINVINKRISSLQGIEYFTALTELYCDFNRLSSLDLSKNTRLKELYCNQNNLTTLDLSTNRALEYLGCSSNQIIGLDLSNNESLTKLMCSYNKLEKLDISCNKELWNVTCQYNVLTEITLPESEELLQLLCGNNQLASLDVSKQKALNMLNCNGNKLSELDLSNNAQLQWLWCHNNLLTNLDVSNNPLLVTVGCYGNKIKGDAMNNLIADLPTVSKPGYFYVLDATDITEGNECSIEQVAALKTKNWKAYYCYAVDSESQEKYWIEYSGGSTTGGLDIDDTNFPDETFRNFVTNHYDHNKDGFLSDAERYGVEEIWFRNEMANSIKGIELFPNLEVLWCSDNQLTSLDVSGLHSLKDLYCGQNQLISLQVNGQLESLVCDGNLLTSLDVSHCSQIRGLYCDNNQLALLNVSNCTNLYTLTCSNNQLTTLDVSKCPNLLELSCTNNLLTTLDVSACQDIWHIYCYGNKIKGVAMDALIESLPDWNKDWLYSGTLIVIDETDPNEQNVCSTVHVASAKAKDWQVRSRQGEYEGSTPTAISAIQTYQESQYYDLNGRKTYSQAKKKIMIEQRNNGKRYKVVRK